MGNLGRESMYLVHAGQDLRFARAGNCVAIRLMVVPVRRCSHELSCLRACRGRLRRSRLRHGAHMFPRTFRGDRDGLSGLGCRRSGCEGAQVGRQLSAVVVRRSIPCRIPDGCCGGVDGSSGSMR